MPVTTAGGEPTQMLTKIFSESWISTYPMPERTVKAIRALTLAHKTASEQNRTYDLNPEAPMKRIMQVLFS